MSRRASARGSRRCDGGTCTIARAPVIGVEVADAADPRCVAYGVASSVADAREAAHGRFVAAYGLGSSGGVVTEAIYLDTPVGWVPWDPDGPAN